MMSIDVVEGLVRYLVCGIGNHMRQKSHSVTSRYLQPAGTWMEPYGTYTIASPNSDWPGVPIAPTSK